MEQEIKRFEPMFFTMPSIVMFADDLTSTSKLIYGVIQALQTINKNPWCWPSNAFFQNAFHLSERTVKMSIAELVKNGYVARKLVYKEGTKQVERRYLWTLFDHNSRPIEINFDPQQLPHPMQKNAPPHAKNSPTPHAKNCLENNNINSTIQDNNVAIDTTVSYSNVNKNIGNNNIYIPQSPTSGALEREKDPFNTVENEELRETLTEFEKMRVAIKARLTPHAKKLILSKLEKLAPGNTAMQVEILNQSIVQSWKGVFPLKGEMTSSCKIEAVSAKERAERIIRSMREEENGRHQ